MADQYSVVGIGNAAIDIICSVTEEQFLALKLAVPKASCEFLDFQKMDELEKKLAQWGVECTLLPGGSAANTMSTMGALGGKAAFIGKIANDRLGDMFRQSMAQFNVYFPTPAVADGAACTTRLFAFITPDSERTFAVYHGANDHMSVEDADEDLIASSAVLFLEGYQLATANGYRVMTRGIEHAKKHKRQIVFSPSAISVLETWPDQVRHLVEAADGILCNEEEACHMTGASDVASALEALAPAGKFACITIGAKGAWVRRDGQSVHRPVPAKDIRVVNTNGAGDGFAGGFLYGLTKGWTLDQCLDLGNECAIYVLGQLGPRPDRPLNGLLEAFKDA
jgi:sugar/nucleoside kinase (ribokinase family)